MRWKGPTVVWVGVAVVAFALRALTAGSDVVTTDEPLWITRSERFREALAAGDFAGATAAGEEATTMPGVTTMWVGSAAGRVWDVGHDRGWWAEGEDRGFPSSPAGMDIAQVAMAAAVSVAVGGLTWLVARWAGVVAAVVAGGLVATEPFLVAHGAVLHTDELSAVAGVASVVALALALGLPNPAGTGTATGTRMAVAAGASGAVALLTKLSALTFLPGAAVLVGWALLRAGRAPGRGRGRGGGDTGADRRAAIASLARVVATAAVASVLVMVAAYPALWVRPAAEWAALRRSMGLAEEGHLTFFLGEAVATPGPAFYAVALPLRMTPWFLVALVVAAVAVWRWPTRGHGAVLAAAALPTLVVVSLASKQFDRYGIPVLVAGAVLVGVVAADLADLARRRLGTDRPLQAAAALAAGGAVVVSLAVAPWGLAWFNPLLGGSSTAMSTVLIGWREGLEQVGPIIADRERGRCDDVTIDAIGSPRLYPCGVVRRDDPSADYVVVYVSERQRFPSAVAERTRGRPLVGTVDERGITYVEVYGRAGTPADAARRGWWSPWADQVGDVP